MAQAMMFGGNRTNSATWMPAPREKKSCINVGVLVGGGAMNFLRERVLNFEVRRVKIFKEGKKRGKLVEVFEISVKNVTS